MEAKIGGAYSDCPDAALVSPSALDGLHSLLATAIESHTLIFLVQSLRLQQ